MWLVTFAIYFASPVLQMSDSKYSMLTAESIVHNHTPISAATPSRITMPTCPSMRFAASIPIN